MSGLQAQRIQDKVYIHLHILLSDKPGVFSLLTFILWGRSPLEGFCFCFVFSVIIRLILLMFLSVTLSANLYNLRHLLLVTQKACWSSQGLTASLKGTLSGTGEHYSPSWCRDLKPVTLRKRDEQNTFYIFIETELIQSRGKQANMIVPRQPG